jgi:kumamolisin
MHPRHGLSALSGILFGLALAAALPGAPARAERFAPPSALLAGYQRQFKLDTALRMHVAVELIPKDPGLDAAANAVVDPASPMHRLHLSQAAFTARYGRSQADVDALVAWLHQNGATNVYAARDRLIVGADLTVESAQRAFKTKYDLWQSGERTIVAPTTPLTIPVNGVRAVRGAVKAFTPRLADVIERPGLPTDFRANWYGVAQFRQAYDAVPGGGAGMRIALIEDSSDRGEASDLAPFAQADAAVPLDPSHVTERTITPPIGEQVCGRDDRGQEPTMDVDAALALAPAATIDVRYDEVCVRGGEGTLEIQHALDDAPQPDVIVFPFAVAPLYGPLADAFGPTPIPYLEAALRGIPVVVPSGDDGAYGIRVAGIEKAAVTYPCILAVVICAGGSALGERNGPLDEGPWNDGAHASGGGISFEPRPSWQRAPMEYSLAHTVDRRMVPDLSADAGGHLLVYWHGYAAGGVGGTSESAALVGAQLAAIDGALPPERRLTSAGDLYVLASAHPEAFRDVTRANDRGFADNALHPRPQPLPLGYTGVLPSPAPQVRGCLPIRPRGCDVDKGYDLVTGIGSLKERAAIDALKASQ